MGLMRAGGDAHPPPPPPGRGDGGEVARGQSGIRAHGLRRCLGSVGSQSQARGQSSHGSRGREMAAEKRIHALLAAFVFLLLSSDSSGGRPFGRPEPRTLQEFLGQSVGYLARDPAGHGSGRTSGYGTPKPYLPIIRTVVTDGENSPEHGENLPKSPEVRGFQESFVDEFRQNEISTEHEDANKEGKALGQDYETLKAAAVSSLSKNAYGFKHHPKRYRNDPKESSEKSSGGSVRHLEESSSTVHRDSDDSAGFFSEPDWPDRPLEGRSGDGFHDDESDHRSGFEPGGFFYEEYRVEGDPVRSDGDKHSGTTSGPRQSHSFATGDGHKTLTKFGAMLNFEPSRSHGEDSNSRPGQNGFGSSPGQNDVTTNHFTNSLQEFGPPKESKDFDNFHNKPRHENEHREFHFETSSIKPDDFLSGDITQRESHSSSQSYDPSHVFQPVRERPLLTDRETYSSDFSFSTSSVSNEHNGDVYTTDSPRQHDGHGSDRELRAQVAFEPQRTTSYHREGYNTPKPYKPPPTSPTPRHGAFPLARPGYSGEHGLAAYPEHGPEHGVGLYGASEHSLLGHSAAKHAPGYAQSYHSGHRGYAGYPHRYSVYVHGYRTVPYSSTVVHSDQHQYVGPAYPSGHGDNTLRYGVHPYHTGSGYNSGYTTGHSHVPGYAGEAGYSSGRDHLHGVQLYQITQPLDPHHPNHLEYDHGTHDYVPPGYGTPSHVSPGHGTPGYVSLEYVPAGHAGGYGLKRPEYSSVYHDDYAQYARYGGYGARPYRRADGTVSGTEDEQQPAASEVVETVAEASSPVAETSSPVAEASSAVDVVAQAASPLDVTAEASSPVDIVAVAS
ncbi:hornerin-like [Amphibalanus amphitrite]|uniref:hornerin-like n=1 Tax=Amphibalanus amphitrite TaxID=1232801 RepID=UPI001C92AD77|nr:hornerin-like [Amphibalanus amphitrite]